MLLYNSHSRLLQEAWEITHDDPREATAYDIAASNLPSCLMLEQASDVDIIVTTALIPGRKVPVLVTQEMLDVMKAGRVIVDLAATNRGNVTQTNHREQGHNRRVHQLAIATRVHLVVSFQYQHREIHT